MGYDDYWGASYWGDNYWGDSYWGEYGTAAPPTVEAVRRGRRYPPFKRYAIPVRIVPDIIVDVHKVRIQIHADLTKCLTRRLVDCGYAVANLKLQKEKLEVHGSLSRKLRLKHNVAGKIDNTKLFALLKMIEGD